MCSTPLNRQINTHVGHNLDLFVLHFIEDVCVAERLQERRPRLALTVEELDKLLQLRAAFLKILGKFLASRLIWKRQSASLWAWAWASEGQAFKVPIAADGARQTPFSFLRVSLLHMSILMAASCFSLRSTSSMDRLYLDSWSISAWGWRKRNGEWSPPQLCDQRRRSLTFSFRFDEKLRCLPQTQPQSWTVGMHWTRLEL